VESLTFPVTNPPLFPTSPAGARPVVVTGGLTLPPGAGRTPAVILAHGCSGVTAGIQAWASTLVEWGYAVLVLDSFGGRDIQEVCTGRWSISSLSRILDAYRALELLATHPRVDPARIALMGFSHGGRIALWAAMERFRERWARPGAPGFAAYLAFYPASCWYTLAGEAAVSDRPIRLFHGTGDDWTPIGPCREYLGRLQRAGRDVALFEYPGAHHGFDNAALGPAVRYAQALNPSTCRWVEEPDGRLVDLDTGRLASVDAACLRRGVTIGYDPGGHRQSVADVRAVLASVFNTRGARSPLGAGRRGSHTP
jgi:dienelactone hydrolase